MKRLFLTAMAVVAVIILAGSAAVRGATLYQNTAFTTGQVLNLPKDAQIGEQIWLGTSAPMYLTNFSFEYYSPLSSYTGPVQADVRLYMNNGAPTNGYNTPGTLFYDSGNFSLQNPWSQGTNTATMVFQLSDLQSVAAGGLALTNGFILPSSFTFSVTISGLQGADAVGLPIFDPPQVGTNAGDYWYDVSGNWELLTNSIGPIAFGAQFQGTIPEPSVLGLGALGAAALAVMARRRQRRG
jgi:hypothetical protein